MFQLIKYLDKTQFHLMVDLVMDGQWLAVVDWLVMV